MLQKKLVIQNKLGLHARAAGKLVKHAMRHRSKITMLANNKRVSAKSILDVMLLAACKGTEITLIVDGRDEIEAMADLESVINDKFGEE